MSLEDAKYLFSSSKRAGCRLHFKQLGTQLALELNVYSNKGKGEHRSKGGNLDQIPTRLRMREWPPIPKMGASRPLDFHRAFEPRTWELF
jgi:hypothetical protein